MSESVEVAELKGDIKLILRLLGDDGDGLIGRVGRLETRVGAGERFQAWLVGLGTAFGAIVGVVVKPLVDKVGGS